MAAGIKSLTFRQYYGKVLARAWRDIRLNVKGTVMAVIDSALATFLRVHWGLLNSNQQWLTTVANALPAILILGSFCLFYLFKAPAEIHDETHIAHARELESAAKAGEAAMVKINGELELLRQHYEDANSQLRLRLIDPVLHFEPEDKMVNNTGSPCNFVVELINTGLADVERVQVFVTHFIAQKPSGNIVLKELGHGSYIAALTVDELKSEGVILVPIAFANLLPIMLEVAKNAGSGVSSIFGIKLHAKFRRRADGREFDVVSCYGADVGGNVLIPPEPFTKSMPEGLRHMVQIGEVVKYLDSSDHWVGVITEIGGSSSPIYR